MDSIKITRANIMDSIEILEKMGFKRWQKNGMDRLYITASALGLDAETLTFKGEKISRSLCSSMMTAKTYIDLNESMIVSSSCDLAYEVAVMIGVDPIGGRCKLQIA